MHQTGPTPAPLGAGNPEPVFFVGIQADTAALGTGSQRLVRCGEHGGVDFLRKRAEGRRRTSHHGAHGFFKSAQRMIGGFRCIGTGKNIVELIEQHFFPGIPILTGKVGGMSFFPGKGRNHLRLIQPVFSHAVDGLHSGLRGITTGKGGAQLSLHHRQGLPIGLHCGKEGFIGGETHCGGHRPFLHIQNHFQILTGRSAAVVAHAVHLHHIVHPIAIAELGHNMEIHGKNQVIVPQRLIEGQHFRAGITLPAVQLHVVQSPAVIEIPDSTSGQHGGNRRRMAEGIGVEVQLYLFHGNAKLVPEIPFGIKDMPGHAFQRRQVLVQLHKRGTGIFPASFLHTGTNPLKQLRVIILGNAVHRSLRLGKCEVRILVHQIQHGAEGVQRHIHRFMEAPHPVHINVGMGHTVHGHGLGGFRQGQQHFFRLAAHGIRQRVLLCPGLIQNVHRLI